MREPAGYTIGNGIGRFLLDKPITYKYDNPDSKVRLNESSLAFETCGKTGIHRS